jgi:hypothetical protein
MKYTLKIIGLSVLLLVLWLFNSYQQGDFQSTDREKKKESMAQMDPRFPALPQTEFSSKKDQLEIDLEEYEKTVNAVNDTIREQINVQNYILDDNQIQLRPIYDTPRYTEDKNNEMINPPPLPKILNAVG